MTVQINHHIVITDAEQQAIVNALAFYEDYHTLADGFDADEREQWRLAFRNDRQNLYSISDLANKIATSN